MQRNYKFDEYCHGRGFQHSNFILFLFQVQTLQRIQCNELRTLLRRVVLQNEWMREELSETKQPGWLWQLIGYFRSAVWFITKLVFRGVCILVIATIGYSLINGLPPFIHDYLYENEAQSSSSLREEMRRIYIQKEMESIRIDKEFNSLFFWF